MFIIYKYSLKNTEKLNALTEQFSFYVWDELDCFQNHSSWGDNDYTNNGSFLLTYVILFFSK